jgi:hypothetical protein
MPPTEADVLAGVGAADVESIRFDEAPWIAIGAAEQQHEPPDRSDGAQERLDRALDGVPQTLDGPGGEGLADERAQAGVMRRVAKQQPPAERVGERTLLASSKWGSRSSMAA